MPFVEFNGKKIFYQIKEAETEKAIIFIHGSGGNSYVWNNQLSKLNLNYNIIAIDLPSHDQSDKFSELTLELYVDVVKHLITTLKLKDVMLAGHSLGGAVIQSYYFNNSDDVSALILVGTGARLRVSPIILTSLQNDYQEFLKGLPIGAFYRRTPKELINEYIAEASKTDPQATYSDFKICDGFDAMDKMSSIKIPCLLICGRDDKLTPPKYSNYLHDNLKTSEMVIIEKASHMVMLEKPEEVNQAIQEFIKKYVAV